MHRQRTSATHGTATFPPPFPDETQAYGGGSDKECVNVNGLRSARSRFLSSSRAKSLHPANRAKLLAAFDQAQHLAAVLEALEGSGHGAALNVLKQVVGAGGRGAVRALFEGFDVGEQTMLGHGSFSHRRRCFNLTIEQRPGSRLPFTAPFLALPLRLVHASVGCRLASRVRRPRRCFNITRNAQFYP